MNGSYLYDGSQQKHSAGEYNYQTLSRKRK